MRYKYISSSRGQISTCNSHVYLCVCVDIDKYWIGGEVETVSHYFFECCNYTNLRNTLLNETLYITNLSVL